MISFAMLMKVYWNLMMKQAKIQFFYWLTSTVFFTFQNYLTIQFAMLQIDHWYDMKEATSSTFLLKNLLSHSSLHDDRILSSYTNVFSRMAFIAGYVSSGRSIFLFIVLSRILSKVFWIVSSMKGWWAQVKKQRTHPADHTSHLAEQGRFCSCSGEEQMGVPLSSERLSIFEISPLLTIRAHPKSAILTVLSFLRRMLSGLRSRWSTSFTFMAIKAFTICLKIPKISSPFKCLFFFLKQVNKSPPSQYSIRISILSSFSLREDSQTLTRLGWMNLAISQIQRRASSVLKGSTCIFFKAYFLPLWSSMRKTVPKLPSPRISIVLYFSIFLRILIMNELNIYL